MCGCLIHNQVFKGHGLMRKLLAGAAVLAVLAGAALPVKADFITLDTAMLFVFIGATPTPPTITYIGRHLITNNQSDYAWNDVSVGAASASKLVVVWAAAYTSATLPFGVRYAASGSAAAGSLMNEVTGTVTDTGVMWQGMFYISLTSETTHSFYIDGNGAMNHGSISIWIIEGLNSHTPESGVSDVATAFSLPLTNSVNAAVIAGGTCSAATTATWSGVSEDFDVQSEGLTFSGASGLAGSANVTITPTFGSETGLNVSAAAWR